MPIKNGDTVLVHYVGTLNDGSEFDRSSEGSPLRFQLGRQQVIPGFERAVLGHEKGDSFSVTIPADQAYGEHQENLIFPLPRTRIPTQIKPELGMALHMATDQGELEVRICGMDEERILLDANHPMAGKDLTFALRIADIL